MSNAFNEIALEAAKTAEAIIFYYYLQQPDEPGTFSAAVLDARDNTPLALLREEPLDKYSTRTRLTLADLDLPGEQEPIVTYRGYPNHIRASAICLVASEEPNARFILRAFMMILETQPGPDVLLTTPSVENREKGLVCLNLGRPIREEEIFKIFKFLSRSRGLIFTETATGFTATKPETHETTQFYSL